LLKEQQAQQSQFLATLQGLDPKVRQGAVTGEAIGRVFRAWRGRDEPSAVDTSREVVAAKAKQALISDLRGLGEKVDMASSDYAVQAAAKAKAAGREDLAYQFLAEAATRRKAEAAQGLKVKQQALENQRAALNTMPAAQKYSWIVNNKEEAGQLYSMQGEALDKFHQDARDNLATEQAKNLADLQKVNVVNPVNTTAADEKQTTTGLEGRGWNQDAFDIAIWPDDGSGAQRLFTNKMTEQVATEQSILSKRGINRTKDDILGEVLGVLESEGAIKKHDVFDADKINSVLRQRLETLKGSTAPATATPQAPAAAGAPAQGLAPVDYDFSK